MPPAFACLCTFAKTQGSFPVPAFIYSPLSHQVLLALPPKYITNLAYSPLPPLFQFRSSHHHIWPGSQCGLLVGHSQHLFLQVTTRAIFKKHQSSSWLNLPKLPIDFRIKSYVWPWSPRPVLGRPCFWLRLLISTPRSTVHCSPAHWLSPTPSKYATAACLHRILFLWAIFSSSRSSQRNLSQPFYLKHQHPSAVTTPSHSLSCPIFILSVGPFSKIISVIDLNICWLLLWPHLSTRT